MQIHGLNKTTLLDYPEHVAATVFTGGCNFCCPFCHNGNLVLHPRKYPLISVQEVLHFLQKRKNVLTGVCVTGGEPTLQPDLPDFIRRVKDMGYLVKLDTNGYRPEILRTLLEENLLDYVAMDIKNAREKYDTTVGLKNVDMQRIEESVVLLKECKISYEFRTTVVRELHTKEDFISIGEWIAGAGAYFLQNYRENENVIKKGFSACTAQEMKEFTELLKSYVKVVRLRGVEE